MRVGACPRGEARRAAICSVILKKASAAAWHRPGPRPEPRPWWPDRTRPLPGSSPARFVALPRGPLPAVRISRELPPTPDGRAGQLSAGSDEAWAAHAGRPVDHGHRVRVRARARTPRLGVHPREPARRGSLAGLVELHLHREHRTRLRDRSPRRRPRRRLHDRAQELARLPEQRERRLHDHRAGRGAEPAPRDERRRITAIDSRETRTPCCKPPPCCSSGGAAGSNRAHPLRSLDTSWRSSCSPPRFSSTASATSVARHVERTGCLRQIGFPHPSPLGERGVSRWGRRHALHRSRGGAPAGVTSPS